MDDELEVPEVDLDNVPALSVELINWLMALFPEVSANPLLHSEQEMWYRHGQRSVALKLLDCFKEQEKEKYNF